MCRHIKPSAGAAQVVNHGCYYCASSCTNDHRERRRHSTTTIIVEQQRDRPARRNTSRRNHHGTTQQHFLFYNVISFVFLVLIMNNLGFPSYTVAAAWVPISAPQPHHRRTIHSIRPDLPVHHTLLSAAADLVPEEGYHDIPDDADNNNHRPDHDVLAVDSAMARVDQWRFQQHQRGRPDNDDDDESLLMKAAAAVTLESCRLIGMKSLGVDYGLVKTGLAVTVGYDPKPLAILTGYNSSTTDCCQEIVKYAQTELVSQIVVGLPLHKNGTEAEQTILTKAFASELATAVLRTLGPSVPVVMWDERYTSKFAAARAVHQSRSGERVDLRQDLYGTLDADAACIILEHYYSKNGEGHHPVLVPKAVQGECLREYETSRKQKEQAALAAKELRLVGGRSTQRQEAMDRARQLEAEMAKEGRLGVSRKQNKKKKKKKKKRTKRGPWLTPTNSGNISQDT